MTKKLLTYVLAFLILGIFFSCESDNPHFYMDDAYKIALEANQQLIYKSNTGELDTFIVKFKHNSFLEVTLTGSNETGPFGFYEFEYIVICPFETDSCQCDESGRQSNSYWYSPIYKNCDSCIKIIKNMDTQPTKVKNKRMGNPNFNWQNNWKFNLDSYQSIINHIMNNGQYFSEVYVFYKKDIINPVISVNKIFYNHKFGILRFEYTNGEIWELDRII